MSLLRTCRLVRFLFIEFELARNHEVLYNNHSDFQPLPCRAWARFSPGVASHRRGGFVGEGYARLRDKEDH